MDVTSRTVGGVVVVTLEGELDGKTAPVAQQRMVELIPEHGRMLIDMSGVGYMSSAGLRMLLLVYRQALSRDGAVALVGLSDEIHDTMDATGFLDFFTVGSSIEEGVRSLGTPT